MNIELDGLRSGERFPFTSGKNEILNNLFKEQSKIFSTKELPDFRCKHESVSEEVYSDCGCGAEMDGEDLDYGLCPVCHDHCGGYKICLDCEDHVPYE